MTDETTTEKHCFRLTGEVEGTQFTYDLADGEYVAGAADISEIFLEVAGVSRRHAILTVEGGVLRVEDLGSKNGTFVNGRRIEEASLDEGDWIGFGPTVLYVIRVHPDDAKVAIPLYRTRRRGERNDDTTEVKPLARRAEDEPPAWVDLLNRLSDLLIGAEDPDHSEALDVLRQGVGAESACVIDWDGNGAPVVLCACGAVLEGSMIDAVEGAFSSVAETGSTEPVMLNGRVDGDGSLTWAAAAAPSVSPWGLVLAPNGGPPALPGRRA